MHPCPVDHSEVQLQATYSCISPSVWSCLFPEICLSPKIGNTPKASAIRDSDPSFTGFLEKSGISYRLMLTYKESCPFKLSVKVVHLNKLKLVFNHLAYVCMYRTVAHIYLTSLKDNIGGKHKLFVPWFGDVIILNICDFPFCFSGLLCPFATSAVIVATSKNNPTLSPFYLVVSIQATSGVPDWMLRVW